MTVRADVVIPTSGRASLGPLLEALAGFPLGAVHVVEDRGRRGPAWARNVGWRRSDADWICFLDDDVVLDAGWVAALEADLDGARPWTGASQGRLTVPLPTDRAATDWERNVAGLQDARWITADLAVRRDALRGVGGFDERFPRAYREDADLGLRLVAAGWHIGGGERHVTHPVAGTSPWVSVRKQAGNADDALMRRLHGRGWRQRCGAPHGAFNAHLATVACAAIAATATVTATVSTRRSRPHTSGRLLTIAGAAGWTALTARFAWRRIAPGPRTPAEVATMLATSAAIPPAAVAHRLAGEIRARRIAPTADAPGSAADGAPPAAVLLDRDGTLVVDVPYNGDPQRVQPMPGARQALDRLRAAGIPLAVVSNQSGVARGLLDEAQVTAVNQRVEDLLGPFGTWIVCPHDRRDGCACRKPRPGMLLEAARRLGVDPQRCAMIGDIGSDVRAGRAAGARPVLVPTAATRAAEVHAAPEVAPDLHAAVDLLLGPPR